MMTKEELQDLQDLFTLENCNDEAEHNYTIKCFDILMFLHSIKDIEDIMFQWKFYERVDNNLLNQSKILSFFNLEELTIKCFREHYMKNHNRTYEVYIQDHYNTLIAFEYEAVLDVLRTFDDEFVVYFTYNNKHYEIEQYNWYKELKTIQNSESGFTLDKFLTIITGEKYEKKY